MWDKYIYFDPADAGYWEQQSKFSDTVMSPTTGGSGHPQLSTCSLVFTRTTPTSIVDDVMVTSFNFAGAVIANATSPLTSAEKATIEGLLNTWWTTVKPFCPSSLTLKEYRWHDYADVKAKPGPAVRITAVGVAATGSIVTAVPDQVAETQTFRTASRRHWGRVYLPKLAAGAFDQYGRIVASTVDGLAAATRTLFNGADTAGVEVVVPSREHGAILTITELAMDSTPDVIRRRRAKHPSYIKAYSS